MKQVIALIGRAEKWVERLCRYIAFISMTLIFITLTLNVFARYLRIDQLQVGSEIPEVLFPWLVSASVGLAAIHGAHISIHILADRLSGTLMRFMGTAMSLVAITLYGLTLAIVIELLPIVKDDRSPMLGISLGWTYAAMAVSFTAILLNQVACLARIWGLLGDTPPGHMDPQQAIG